MEENNFILKNYHLIYIIYYILNFLILLGLALFILFLFYDPYLLRGKTINNYSNDYCNNENNPHHDLLCTNKYFNYRKSKFIWLTIDGTATDQLVELHNFEKYKITTSFLSMGKYNKYTNMLYESMMTGKYNKNLGGSSIKYDNFIKQVLQAEYKISYRGWTLPIPGLIGDDLNNQFYFKHIDNGHEIQAFNSFCNMTNLFPFLNIDIIDYQKTDPNNKISRNLEQKIIDLINQVKDDDYYLLKNISKNLFFDELDKIFSEEKKILLELNITECLIKNFNWTEEENISVIFYSTEVDEFNHFYGKNHIYSLLQSYIAEKMIINLIKWIDNHRDYALIINSDHGGQHFYGEDTLRNHGEDFVGNEGIFYIYTYDFKINYEKLKLSERYINIIDESVLMSDILLNVDIPLESKGIPYQLINDEKLAYSSLKRKEMQLINLIQNYDKNKKNKEFQKILKELNESFDDIGEIKSKYLNGVNSNNDNLMKELHEVNKNNLDRIINQQNKINEIIQKYQPDKNNILITVIIYVVMTLKTIFECYYILELLINKFLNNSFSLPQKIILIFFIIFYLFIFEFIFLFLSDSSIKLQFFVRLYIFITCVILIILYYITSYQNISNIKLDKKIYYYFILTFGYLFFQLFFEYSYCYNTIKAFFARYRNQLLLNIFFLYPFLIIFSLRELRKCNFKNKNKLGEYVFKYIIVINIIFIISIFLEDVSYRTYYSQNKLNLISMYIAFVLYVLYFFSCFVINVLDLINEKNEKIKIQKQIEINYDNNIKNVPIKSYQNEVLNISKTYDYYNSNLIFLKLCVIQGSFWLSDESEKIIIFISLVFFELTEHMKHYLYLNYLNGNKNAKNKNKNITCITVIFYVIIQKITLGMNQMLFLLVIHSYDFNSSKQQKQKFIKISSLLSSIATFIANYKFSFVVAVYFIEKNILKKKKKKNK